MPCKDSIKVSHFEKVAVQLVFTAMVKIGRKVLDVERLHSNRFIGVIKSCFTFKKPKL